MSEALRVALDVRMAHHTGIGRYIRGLTHGLMEICGPQGLTLLGPAAQHGWAPSEARRIEYSASIYGIAEQFSGSRLCRDPALAHHVFHFPHYNVPWMLPSRSVVSIHDLTHFLFARSHARHRVFLARRLLTRAIARAGAVIAVSTATAEALLVEYPRVRDKLSVVHHGLDSRFACREPQLVARFRSSHGLTEPLLLYVGNDRPHKNLSFFVKTAERLRVRIPALTLALVGPIDRDYRRQGWILQPGVVPDDELVLWYNAASVLIQPSLSEGFGLTALEAMACGTPVAVSRIPAHEEIVGPHGCYFDPSREDSLIGAVLESLQDAAERAERIAHGRRRAATFGWSRAAEQTREVYRRVARDSKRHA